MENLIWNENLHSIIAWLIERTAPIPSSFLLEDPLVAEMERPVGGMLLGFSSCQAAYYSSAEEDEEEDGDIKE